MSVRFLNNNSSNNTDSVAKTFTGSTPSVLTPWVRNPSWPACEANSGDNRIRGLYAVWPGGGNFIAMLVSGAYTVDFGDGTTTNYATGVQANYEYSYSAAALVGTEAPVTFTDVDDTVNRTAHGYSNGMTVQFFNITTTTGIVNSQFYFVINATSNTFQVSATSGGSAIALTNDGTGQLLPYRIATVTITPQSGQNLTSVNLYVRNNTSLLQAYSISWLDLAFAASTITSLTIGSSSTSQHHLYLERVRLNQLGSIPSFSTLFANLRQLQNIEIANTITTVTTMSSMFSNCYNLKTVPLFNTAAVTNMSVMFATCYSLQTVPLFNTAAVTDMSAMFAACLSLQTLPLFNTAAVTTFTSMCNNCYSLQSVPAWVVTAVGASSGFTNMFGTCSSLSRIEAKNFRFTFSVINCKLSQTSLDEIYTNLPTVTTQTITVTNNYGTATDNPAIATAKGWTVTG